MEGQGTFTRRDVNCAPLTTALAIVDGQNAVACQPMPLFGVPVAGAPSLS